MRLNITDLTGYSHILWWRDPSTGEVRYELHHTRDLDAAIERLLYQGYQAATWPLYAWEKFTDEFIRQVKKGEYWNE